MLMAGQRNEVVEGCSTNTALAAGATFTGLSYMALYFNAVVVSCKTDQDGMFYVDFSVDGTNWDSSLPFHVTAGLNEVHRLTISKKYLRVRFENTASSDQTYLRLQTLVNHGEQLTSPFNLASSQDADAAVVKAISDEILVSSGLLSGYSVVNKFGLNSDVDTGTVPEDIWEGGGTYTGWATSAETVEVFSSSIADVNTTGTGAWQVRIIGLDSNYNVQSETVNLNGTTSVFTTASFLRVHTASIIAAGSGGVNAGVITFRQSSTTANVFLSMQIGRNQTNCSAYTIPAGYTGYMRGLHIACGKATSVSIEGNIWTRTFGQVFRSRRPFFIADTYRLQDDIYGGLVFTEKSDLVIRIVSCSVNNTPINGGYDLVLVKNLT